MIPSSLVKAKRLIPVRAYVRATREVECVFILLALGCHVTL